VIHDDAVVVGRSFGGNVTRRGEFGCTSSSMTGREWLASPEMIEAKVSESIEAPT
jgi:hypothetical protein